MNNKDKNIPTLYEWMGGMEKFHMLTDSFYKKVLSDELLGPVFSHMSPEHQHHVANFIAQVFGGPKSYTDNGGSHHSMILKHLGKHLTEAHRKRWISLLMDTVDELKLPDDPEFRSALIAYIEWGTRIAVLNSNISVSSLSENEPMPEWGWGVPGGPFTPDLKDQ